MSDMERWATTFKEIQAFRDEVKALKFQDARQTRISEEIVVQLMMLNGNIQDLVEATHERS